ncbi:MAG: ABC transporter ATP-binding protein, partial [Ideonella sp.]|nr:ABC transporter ATP-binding protein [Ideonella sp.]
MTPQLMQAGAEARSRRPPPVPSASGGREASYGRLLREGELDLTHGTILYLDDITVSFDGFKALNALSLDIRA